MSLLKKQKRKGFSLLEILLVLAIAAALVVGAFIVYPKVQSGERAQREAQKIATIAAGVKSLYAAVAYYTDVSTASVVHAHVFPDDMLPDATSTQPVNAWKGAVTIAPSNEGPSGVTGSSFTITYPNVPAIDCTRVVSQIAVNYYIVRVGSTVVKPSNGLLDPASLGVACQAGGNSNTLNIESY